MQGKAQLARHISPELDVHSVNVGACAEGAAVIMYDTIHCYLETTDCEVSLLDDYQYVDSSVSGERLIRSRRSDVYIAYSDGMLRVQFSIPHLLDVVYENITTEMAGQALDIVDAELRAYGDYPSVRDWTVTRVDYAWNFHVQDCASYLVMLRELHHKYPRIQYPDGEGVLWKASSRAIKFYNKARQVGRGDPQRTLRFEVSNRRMAIRYMCKHWFNCERTVAQLLQPERAAYVLHRFWYELGLHHEDAFVSRDALLYQLQEAFGSSALAAHTALHLIATHGAAAHKQALLTRSQYYRWRDKLREHAFLPYTEYSLTPLSLPTNFLSSSSAQNLKLLSDPARIFLQKILGEIEVRP